MAMLDPLARHDFMATVMTAVVDDGVSVVLSSHVLAELERVADYLVLISRGGSRWWARSMISSRAIACSPARARSPIGMQTQWNVVHDQPWRFASASARPRATARPIRCHRDGRRTRSTLEELTLAYLREPGAAALPGPSWAPATPNGRR